MAAHYASASLIVNPRMRAYREHGHFRKAGLAVIPVFTFTKQIGHVRVATLNVLRARYEPPRRQMRVR